MEIIKEKARKGHLFIYFWPSSVREERKRKGIIFGLSKMLKIDL
jgi:hypothetical protein